MQSELFENDLSSELSSEIELLNASAQASLDGLEIVHNFIAAEEEDKLLEAMNGAPWSTELERRVQHYGYKYDYRNRRLDESMRVGELPPELKVVADRLAADGYFANTPDQCIVNEYLPGQGIAPHIDCEPCFGDTIASLSLQAPVMLDFTRADTKERHSVWLARRTLVVLKGSARYEWRHGIARRRKDVIHGVVVPRSRRVSLTFRSVVIP